MTLLRKEQDTCDRKNIFNNFALLPAVIAAANARVATNPLSVDEQKVLKLYVSLNHLYFQNFAIRPADQIKLTQLVGVHSKAIMVQANQIDHHDARIKILQNDVKLLRSEVAALKRK